MFVSAIARIGNQANRQDEVDHVHSAPLARLKTPASAKSGPIREPGQNRQLPESRGAHGKPEWFEATRSPDGRQQWRMDGGADAELRRLLAQSSSVGGWRKPKRHPISPLAGEM
ncbi:hypothetical protein, partial [Mesorhizobium sp.]|uniref:hypothetical protein n=1 Tax=Mesorhizobium sp. TaxID=1871066 RepID=UPI0025FB7052